MSEFTMPPSAEEQKKLMAFIKEAIRCMNEIEVQKSDIKMVQSDLKDQFGMDGATSKSMINFFYDQQKIMDQVAGLTKVISDSELIAKYI